MSVSGRTYYTKHALPSLETQHLFHSAAMFDLYEGISHYQPLMVVAFEGEKPIATMFAVIMRMNRILRGKVFRRCYVSRIPAFFDESHPHDEVFAALMDKLIEEVEPKAMYIEYRNMGDPIFGYKTFRKHRFYSIKWMNVRNSLQRRRDIWNQLFGARKNQVHKAKRKGVVIEELTSESALPAIYKLIEKGNPWKMSKRFPPYSYFENFFHAFIQQNKGKIFLAKHHDKIIGGIILALHDKMVYSLYYWGKTKSHKTFYPNVFAIHHAMRWAEKNNYLFFDFMDAGYLHEKAGRPRFLLQFGGKQSATRRWYRINRSWLNFFANKIYD